MCMGTIASFILDGHYVSIILLMDHPNIHSLSPYQLIKYLINYPIRNLIALLLNLITNQLRLTIDK